MNEMAKPTAPNTPFLVTASEEPVPRTPFVDEHALIQQHLTRGHMWRRANPVGSTSVRDLSDPVSHWCRYRKLDAAACQYNRAHDFAALHRGVGRQGVDMPDVVSSRGQTGGAECMNWLADEPP